MKKIFYLICFILVISGCGFKQRPSWIIDSGQQLESFKNNFLTGTEPSGTELNFRKAIEEIKKSGDLDLLQKAWLTRMALQGAVLKEMDEGDYRNLANLQPVRANENFYLFLKGDIAAVNIELLPEQYRKFLKTLRKDDIIKTGQSIASIKDEPVSQLIAAGIALRLNLESEAIIRTAAETASGNGWKMALISWLARLSSFYETAGEADKAAEVRRRIDLIEK
jgi:hypothetical protein